jgi:hypothetical protein
MMLSKILIIIYTWSLVYTMEIYCSDLQSCGIHVSCRFINIFVKRFKIKHWNNVKVLPSFQVDIQSYHCFHKVIPGGKQPLKEYLDVYLKSEPPMFYYFPPFVIKKKINYNTFYFFVSFFNLCYLLWGGIGMSCCWERGIIRSFGICNPM